MGFESRNPFLSFCVNISKSILYKSHDSIFAQVIFAKYSQLITCKVT